VLDFISVHLAGAIAYEKSQPQDLGIISLKCAAATASQLVNVLADSGSRAWGK